MRIILLLMCVCCLRLIHDRYTSRDVSCAPRSVDTKTAVGFLQSAAQDLSRAARVGQEETRACREPFQYIAERILFAGQERTNEISCDDARCAIVMKITHITSRDAPQGPRRRLTR